MGVWGQRWARGDVVAKHFDEVSIYRAAFAFEKAGDRKDLRAQVWA